MRVLFVFSKVMPWNAMHWSFSKLFTNIDFLSELGCLKLADLFSVGNTAIANILKQGKTLITDFEFFKRTNKKHRHRKCHILNEIFYKWYGKYTSSNIYPDEALLPEETMQIKKEIG